MREAARKNGQRGVQRAGSEMPSGQSPYSSLQQKDKSEEVGKSEWGDEERASYGLVHPSVSGGKRVACGLSRGIFKHRSDRCMPVDQSLTTPFGDDIFERTAISVLHTSK